MSMNGVLERALSLETNSRHSDYITALRGISALSIIMLHVFSMGYVFNLGPEFKLGQRAVSYIEYLTMGAPYFLFLSAYSLCLSNIKKSSINTTSFYIRRFFRIAPLFYFMTVVYILWNINHSVSVPRMSVLGNIFFVFNFMPQYGYFKGIIAASWFIGVIMPLYLFFPVIFRFSQKASRVVWLLIISLIISYSFRLSLLWLSENGMEQQLNMLPGDMIWYGHLSLIANLPYFVMGITAYHISTIFAKYKNQKRLGGILFVLTMIALIGLPNMSDQYMDNPVPLKYVIGLLFIPLTLSLAIHGNKLIVNRFTVFLGKVSYSLYLVHVFIILRMIPLYGKIYAALNSDWLSFIFCYALTVFVVAFISLFTYKLIELPGSRIGDYFNKNFRVPFPGTSRLDNVTDEKA